MEFATLLASSNDAVTHLGWLPWVSLRGMETTAESVKYFCYESVLTRGKKTAIYSQGQTVNFFSGVLFCERGPYWVGSLIFVDY